MLAEIKNMVTDRYAYVPLIQQLLLVALGLMHDHPLLNHDHTTVPAGTKLKFHRRLNPLPPVTKNDFKLYW